MNSHKLELKKYNLLQTLIVCPRHFLLTDRSEPSYKKHSGISYCMGLAELCCDHRKAVWNLSGAGLGLFRGCLWSFCGASTDATSGGWPVVSVGVASLPPLRVVRGYQRAIWNLCCDLWYVVFGWPVQFSMCFAWGWQSYVVTYGMWFSVGPCNFQCVLHAIGRSML